MAVLSCLAYSQPMSRYVQLSRRSFVILVSTMIPATKAVALAKLFPFIDNSAMNPLSQATKTYVCPPCGLECDKLIFDKPGACPACGMTLIEKAAGTPPPDTRVQLPDDRSSVQFPFELLANSIFLPVLVNHKGPFLFNLDTGSTNSVVASEAAAEMGIQTQGSMTGSGAGSSSNEMGMISNLDFLLPEGLALSTHYGATVGMSGLWPLLARRLYGDLGYDVLHHFVVEINYEKKLLTFHDPEKYRYVGPGMSFPFKLFGGSDPQIQGQLILPGQSTIPVPLTLDTGAGGTIVTSPLVKSNRIIERVGKVLPSHSHGVGNGESRDLWARLEGLRIGPYELKRPIAALSTDTEGSLANANLGVNLGGNLLRRFNLIVDYPGHRLILEPNSQFHEPFAADASGLVLKASGADFKTFVVDDIAPSSPATEAGLQEGDVILAIDGDSTRKYALWELQDEFKKSGRVYALKIQRGGTTFVRKLRLRSLL